MAKQKGMFPLQGTIGNISFYKSGDTYRARTKGGPSAEQIATHPTFERTRENISEFGRGSRASKLLRSAFRPLLPSIPDERMVSRLNGQMIYVLKADTKNIRGMRTVSDGNAALLNGFEFNEKGKLSTSFFAQYISDINRATGELKVIIPAFIPQVLIDAPHGATHFKLISGGAEVDFAKGWHSADLHFSPELPLINERTAEYLFNNIVSANSSHPLFLVLGIEFFQELNGTLYPLKDG